MGELFLPAHQHVESFNARCIYLERIDLKRVQPRIERASKQAYAIDNVAECLSINWRVAAASTQHAQHSLNLVPLNGKDTHSYVFKDFRPDPAKPQREYKPPERIAHDAYKQLYAGRSYWAHEHPFDLGSRTAGMHLLHHLSEGCTHGLFRIQVKGDAANIALVGERRGLDLQNDRKAELMCRPHRLLRGRSEHAGDERNTGLLQERTCLRLGPVPREQVSLWKRRQRRLL